MNFNSQFATQLKAFGIKKALKYLEKDPEENIPKLMKLVDSMAPGDLFAPQRDAIRGAIEEKGHWYQFIMRLYDMDPGIREAFFTNFIVNASLVGNDKANKIAKEENCNVPWAILVDPTTACNLHCTGCWAGQYGNHLNLTLEELNNIVEQGKELGIHMYIYTGGEPLVRKADLMKLCEMHPDCEFLSFTNGTLIDEAFCQEMLRVKNFVPALSLEGFEDANDSRRGEGVFKKVNKAMELMKAHKIPFGISACYTSRNCYDITSDEFIDHVVNSGAYFIWYFHYMPVGNHAAPELMVTPEQRKMMIERIRYFRNSKPIFSMDFQNDAQFVDGCIAGGKNYLHINANGDVEPCVFIHYSNANIKEVSLLEALKSPLFMAYHDNQPFNDDMLRPCPMLENPERLREMVAKSGAKSTDLESPETVEHLCSKCDAYAATWKEHTKELWPQLKKDPECKG